MTKLSLILLLLVQGVFSNIADQTPVIAIQPDAVAAPTHFKNTNKMAIRALLDDGDNVKKKGVTMDNMADLDMGKKGMPGMDSMSLEDTGENGSSVGGKKGREPTQEPTPEPTPEPCDPLCTGKNVGIPVNVNGDSFRTAVTDYINDPASNQLLGYQQGD
jgi:hypothetical protein